MERKKLKRSIGKIKVRWFDRYYTYLNRPLSLVQFFIVVFLGLIAGIPNELIVILLGGVVFYTYIIARHDERVLAQEMEYLTRINPFFLKLERDIEEIKRTVLK